jgi:predicted 2-oxoglutarate/Fe(II)-dependent dioxygenase YbiX
MHEPFEVCPQVFDESEIEFIKLLGDSEIDGTIEQKGFFSRTKSTIALPPRIVNKLKKVIQRSNYYEAFELFFPTKFERFVMATYDSTQSLKIHNDVSQNAKGDSVYDRKISMLILLDDNYEGGEWFMHDVGLDDPFLITLQPGDGLLFPSFYNHSMNPITSGQRKAFTTWVTGPRWQ